MMGLGWQELSIILLIVVVIFGVGKLPELGSGLGRGIRDFKAEATDDGAHQNGDAAIGQAAGSRELRADQI
jgi:sec-independent protein translocase protein TatA